MHYRHLRSSQSLCKHTHTHTEFAGPGAQEWVLGGVWWLRRSRGDGREGLGSHLPENPEAIKPAKENLADKDGQHNVIYGREQLIVFLHGRQRKREGQRGQWGGA